MRGCEAIFRTFSQFEEWRVATSIAFPSFLPTQHNFLNVNDAVSHRRRRCNKFVASTHTRVRTAYAQGVAIFRNIYYEKQTQVHALIIKWCARVIIEHLLIVYLYVSHVFVEQ